MRTDKDFLTFTCYFVLLYNILIYKVINLSFKRAEYNAKNGTLWLATVIVVFIAAWRLDESQKKGTARYLWLFPAMIPATFFRLVYYQEEFGIIDGILMFVVIGFAVLFFLKADFRFGMNYKEQ